MVEYEVKIGSSILKFGYHLSDADKVGVGLLKKLSNRSCTVATICATPKYDEIKRQMNNEYTPKFYWKRIKGWREATL